MITSHTLVKNGMPFIGEVLKRALPYVERALVTVSVNSSDGTLNEIFKLKSSKIEICFEDVSNIHLLTKERQKQVAKTTSEWIWFLDDDDLYPEKTIHEVIRYLGDDIDGIALNPYQVLTATQHDHLWYKKYFTKFFRSEGIEYRGEYPRDLIYKNGDILYWRNNKRVMVLPHHRFYHLARLKDYSFRQKHPAHEYNQPAPWNFSVEAQSWLSKQNIPRLH